MTRIRALAALLSVAALAACEKNAVQDIAAPATGAFVRFHNYGVGTPAVNLYSNDQKVTGVSSTSCTPANDPRCTTTGIESTSGTSYGAVANGGNYSQLPTGQTTLASRLATTADNGLAVSSVSMPLADGKFYSYFTSGFYNTTTKKVDAFVIEDALPTSFDYSKAYVRVVNASSNSPSISMTTQLQGSTEVVTVATGLGYQGASPIVTVTPGLTDLTATIGGVSVKALGVNLPGGHVITFVLRGDATSTSTTTGLAITATANR